MNRFRRELVALIVDQDCDFRNDLAALLNSKKRISIKPSRKQLRKHFFRKRLSVLIDDQDCDFRNDLAALLGWRLQGYSPEPDDDVPPIVKRMRNIQQTINETIPRIQTQETRGQKPGALHSRSIPVLTPKGLFVSITAASVAFGITRQAGLHRLRTGVWSQLATSTTGNRK